MATSLVSVDFRKLHDGRVVDFKCIPQLTHCSGLWGENSFFSKHDITHGYWEIHLSDESIAKTPFSTATEPYQSRVIPFGLKTASTVFAKLIGEVLRRIPGIQYHLRQCFQGSCDMEEHIQTLG